MKYFPKKSKPVKKNSPNRDLCSAKDSTENPVDLSRLQLIEKSKMEWEKTVDAVDDIITLLDTELKIVRANRAAHEKFNFKLGELVGLKCHQAFYNKPLPCEDCPLLSISDSLEKSDGVKHFENSGKTFDICGSPIFDQAGRLCMIAHVARDLTSQLTEQEQKSQLLAAVDQTTESIVIIDTKGFILYTNPAFTKITGYTSDEIVGRNISCLRSDKHEDHFYAEIWASLLRGEVWKGKVISRKKDQSLFTEETTLSPIFDSEGEITSFVAVQRDVSREEAIEKQLQQALKLEAVATLASGIAHDFNNILSTMLGYAYMAKGQLSEQTPVSGSLDNIITAGDRAVDLIKQLLTFSRNEQSPGSLKPLSLQYLLKESLKLFRPSLPDSIKLIQDIDPACPPMLADVVEMQQVLMNLLENARQAIDDNWGTIQVTLKPDKKRERLCFTIADSGRGMSEGAVERIFDPFFSTEPKGVKAGLGLSVVHGIVKRHNGSIGVESNEGQGTTFILSFPLSQPERRRDMHSLETASTDGKEHLLVVDDESQLLDYLELVLKRKGYKVTSFVNSLEAIEYYRQNSETIDLVLTDMTMPEMSGAELAKEVLAIRPELPVILTTGSSEFVDRERALRIGIREFMEKPLRKSELEKTIRKVLDHG